METVKKMPITKILLLFSWLAAFASLALGVYYMIKGEALVNAILLAIGGIVIASLLRILANIGQLLFDLKYALNILIERSTLESQETRKCIRHNMINLNTDLKQINCDSKEISQDVHKLRDFIEQVQQHLDLTK